MIARETRKPSGTSSWLDGVRLSEHGPPAILATLVVLSAQGLAGQPTWVLLSLACLALLGLAIQSPTSTNRVVRALRILLVLLAAYTALQAVPLPTRMIQALSPWTGNVWSEALDLTGISRSFIFLSADPGATAEELLKWAIYGATLSIAATVVQQHGHRSGLRLVLISALLVNLVTLAHVAWGAEALFGVYRPAVMPPSSRLGPLLNSNNLAGYQLLGTWCAVALYLAAREERERWLVLAAALWLTVGGVLTGSRGGVAALLLSSLAYVLLRERRVPLRRVWVLGSFALVAAVLLFVASTEQTWALLFEKDTSKIQLFERSLLLIAEVPWFGVGRGAFESAFFAFQPPAGNLAFTDTENMVLQWMSEWGILVSLAAFGVLAFYVRPRFTHRARSSIAALVGIYALVLQNLADLSLELPAFPIALLVVVTSAFEHRRPAFAEEPPRGKFLTLHRAQLALLVLGLAAFSLLRGDLTIARDRKVAESDVRSMMERQHVTTTHEHLVAAILRHPADPFFPQLMGEIAVRRREPGALSALSHTLRRCPDCGTAHLLLAAWLGPRVLHQAMGHLRRAIEDDPTLTTEALQLAKKLSVSPRDALELLPKPPTAAAARTLCDVLRDQSSCLVALERASESSPDDVALNNRFLEELLIARHQGPCPTPGCDDRIEEHIRKMRKQPGGAGLSMLAESMLWQRRGEYERSLHMLERDCSNHPAELPLCMRRRIGVARLLVEAKALREAAEFAAQNCSSPEDCGSIFGEISDAFWMRRDLDDAAYWAIRSPQSDPTLTAFRRAATRAEAAKRPGDALLAQRRAAALAPGDPAIQADLKRLEATSPRLE